MAEGDGPLDGLRKFLNKYAALSIARQEDRDDFLVEFLLIKQEAAQWKDEGKCPSYEGAKEINKKKNRYKDILPYDTTRVILPTGSGPESSDYINANYIKGPTGDVEYIASQGPMPNTVDDFWRMVWKHKPKVIAMLCKEIELGKHRCQRYWPEDDDEMKFNDIKVKLISDKNIGDNLHHRELSCMKGREEHFLTQIHYTAWPDHGAPTSPVPILHLLEQMREDRCNSQNPVVIHCSAGCGRTGAVIAIDYARKLIERKASHLSVFDIVRALRMQRPAMVQSKEQYEYVYEVVNELATRELERTEVGGAAGLHTYVNIMTFKDMPTKEDTTDGYAVVNFKRTLSLNMMKGAHGKASDAPELPVKSPKSGRSVSSSGILESEGVTKGGSLPSHTVQRGHRFYENAPPVNLSGNRPKNETQHRGETKDQGRSSSQGIDEGSLTGGGYPQGSCKTASVANGKPDPPRKPNSSWSIELVKDDIPQTARARSGVVSTGSGKDTSWNGQSSNRPPIAARPQLPKRVTPSRLNSSGPPSSTTQAVFAEKSWGNLDSSEESPVVYGQISKPSLPSRNENNTYETIWAPDKKQNSPRKHEEFAVPPLPERTPESFIFLGDDRREDSSRGADSHVDGSTVASNEPSGHQWFSAGVSKLKKIGNIMSPFSPPAQHTRSRSGGSESNSAFYYNDAPSNEDRTRSLERNIDVSSYPISELGFNKRIPCKLLGPRQSPNHWPDYTR